MVVFMNDEIKYIKYVKSMNHLLGCVCEDNGNNDFVISSIEACNDGSWNCYDDQNGDWVGLDYLKFFDEYGDVIGDYNAYTFKYYGFTID